MSDKKSNETISLKLNDFLVKYKGLVFGFIAVLFVFVIVLSVGMTISSSAVSKGISQIDSIDYTFRKDTDEISGDDLLKKQDEALASLNPLLKNSGVVGSRANFLAADIYFQKGMFEESRECWINAAKKNSSAYTAPIAYYNAAVCSENLNDLESAIEYYEKVVSAKEFYLIDHAYFSLGRVNESKGDFEAAKASYEKISGKTNEWGALAQSRLISIDIQSIQ